MPYNVSVWKTKLIDDLRIPVAALYPDSERQDWEPEREELENSRVRLDWGGDDNYIEGRIEAEWLIVDDIHFFGEFSGYALYDVIEPALKKSKGALVAVRIWEGGDSIDRLIVSAGDVRTEDIEL